MTSLVLIAALALAPLSQEPPGPEPEPSPVEVLRELQQGDEEGDEMVELFQQVEQRLRDIDRMLYDASAGRPLEDAEESGIDRLLKRSRDASKQVLDDIDRILQLALERAQQQQQQQQQGGGQQQQQQQGESPLDQQRPGEQGQRERTPEQGSQEREGEQPQGAQPGDEVPEGPQESGGDPRNQPGQPPPGGATDRVQPGDGADRWGDLPVHVRELFRAQGGGDLPPRYRDWIDAYYRRLNERP